MKRIIIVALSFVLLNACRHLDQHTSTASLQNTYWKLSNINGMPLTTPENAREIHIILTREGEETRLKGFAGCNAIGGSYVLHDNSIRFTVISTKMFCNDRMDAENFLLNALNKADHFKIKSETLTLFQGAKEIAKFESVYFK